MVKLMSEKLNNQVTT